MPRLKPHGDLLGTSRAAHYLRVGRSTVEYWRRRGVLTPTVVEPGPRYLYSVADLDAFRGRIAYEEDLVDDIMRLLGEIRSLMAEVDALSCIGYMVDGHTASIIPIKPPPSPHSDLT